MEIVIRTKNRLVSTSLLKNPAIKNIAAKLSCDKIVVGFFTTLLYSSKSGSLYFTGWNQFRNRGVGSVTEPYEFKKLLEIKDVKKVYVSEKSPKEFVFQVGKKCYRLEDGRLRLVRTLF